MFIRLTGATEDFLDRVIKYDEFQDAVEQPNGFTLISYVRNGQLVQMFARETLDDLMELMEVEYYE